MFREIQSVLKPDSTEDVLDRLPKEEKQANEDSDSVLQDIDTEAIQRSFKQFLSAEEKSLNDKACGYYFLEAEKETNASKKAEIYLEASREEDAGCAQELGKMYFAGEGVPKNWAEAEKYLKMAAECGLPDAMCFLGLLYMYDDKVAGESMDWLCKSAIRGSITAYDAIQKYSQRMLTKKLMETRLLVYYNEVQNKEDRKGSESRFMGCCSYVGICCEQNLNLAEALWMDTGERKGRCFLSFF